MNFLIITSVILALIYLELGVYILFKDIRSLLNRYFFLLSLSFAIWAFFYILVYSADSAQEASMWDVWASIGYILFPAFMVGFKSRLCGYPKSGSLQNLLFFAFLFAGLFFVYSNFNGYWQATEITRGRYAWHFAHDPGNFYYLLFYVYLGIATITTFSMLISWRLKMIEKREIYQFNLIFYPLLLFVFLGVFFDLLLPAQGLDIIPNVGHISSLFWISGIAIGIVKFQLLGNISHLIAEQLIDQIKEIVIFLDPENKILRTNDYTKSLLLDNNNGEILSEDIFRYFENITLLNGFLKKTHEKSHFGPLNVTMKTRSGNLLDVHLYFLSVRNNFEDILGCVVYGHDNREALNLQKEIVVRQQAEKNLRAISEVLETRVKERTLELAESYKELQVKMTERMRVEEQIKSDIAEKEVLINEIHNRVKNNMNVIIALIQTQHKKNIGPAAFQKFRELSQRVRSLLIVHQNLYLSINYSDVDFTSVIRSISSELLVLYNKKDIVELRIEATDVFLDVDYAIPLGIVMNELISNSLQHAFTPQYLSKNKDKKQILYIKFSASNSLYEISVSDNGKGLPKNISIEDLSTNGLPLVEILVRDQINGKLELLNNSEGVSVEISFQANK